MLLNMDQAGICPAYPGFIVAPLPAKKILWEAPTAEAWCLEHNWSLKEREIFGMSSDGELSKIRPENGVLSCSHTTWENWLAETDSFGVLIMIAASML
jgi:hypothetical protein